MRRSHALASFFALALLVTIVTRVDAMPCYSTNLLYSVSSANTNINTIDPANGFAIAPVGNSSFVSAAAARSPLDGNIYYISETSTPQLGVFDTTTLTNSAAFTLTGVDAADTAGVFVRAAFSADGSLYAGSNQTTTIYRISAGGAATAIPVAGFVPGAGDMVFDPANPNSYLTVVPANGSFDLYDVSLNGSPATATAATAVRIGSLGTAAGVQIFGLAYGNNGVLYATDQTSTTIYSVNTATGVASPAGNATIPGGANDLASLPVPQSDDLSVIKTHATTAPIYPGTAINYSLTITNGTTATSSCTLTSVNILDTLPSNVALTGVTYSPPPGGTYNPATGQLTGITLAPGGSLTLGVSGTVPSTTAAGTVFVNSAQVAPPLGYTLPDPNAANNTSSDSATVTGLATTSDFVKTVQNITQSGAAGSSNAAKPQDVLQYALTFTNNSSVPIAGLTLSDDTPLHTLYVAGSAICVTVPTTTPATTCTASAAASPTTNNPDQSTITFQIGGSLAPGATIFVAFRVAVQ